MPRLIDAENCPHCGEPREDRSRAFCDGCGGSLQQRHLSTGCLSTAPLWIAFWLWLLH